MHDLEVLRYLNEQAHFRAIALANEDRTRQVSVAGEIKVVEPPPIFPLSILARKLIGGPPSLGYFIELLEQSETFKDFLDLVRTHLPEREFEIMAEDLNLRACKFSHYFSEQFFPLRDDAFSEDFTVGDLLAGIPVQLLGFSYESYHSFTDFRKGYILVLSLIEAPWGEDPLGFDDEDDEDGMQGSRVPIIEEVGNLVGEGLERLLPDKGWSPGELHEMTDGTEFEGCGDFADWVWGITGCAILDTQGEYSEMGEQIDWSREEVEGLTDDWKQSRYILEKIHRVALLLEQDTESNFRKLLSLLLDKPDIIIPKEQLPLPLG